MRTCVLVRVAATRMVFLAMLVVVAVAAVILAQARPAEAAFPGTNGKIAFVGSQDGRKDIYTMNPDGSERRNLTSYLDRFTVTTWGPHFPDDPSWPSEGTVTGASDPAWSADGTKIAFTLTYTWGYSTYSDIWIMNADGGLLRRLTFAHYGLDEIPGRYRGHPAWSPDGEKIAFSASGGIYTVDTDDGFATTITRLTDGLDFNPTWSPDGNRIAYERMFSSSDRRIMVMSADGRYRVYLTSGREPSWSPDGAKIAFEDNKNVFTYDLASRERNQLTVSTGDYSQRYGWEPSWSPDGNRIAFKRFQGQGHIFTMNATDGGDLRQLTHHSGYSGDPTFFDPDWGPSPTAFSSPPAVVSFCSVNDCVEPTITNLRPAPGSSTRDRTPTIRATVSDDRANLAKSDIKLFVDGRAKSTFSYDRSTDRLSYTSGRLSYGKHTVRIEAKDAYNNGADESWRFRVAR